MKLTINTTFKKYIQYIASKFSMKYDLNTLWKDVLNNKISPNKFKRMMLKESALMYRSLIIENGLYDVLRNELLYSDSNVKSELYKKFFQEPNQELIMSLALKHRMNYWISKLRTEFNIEVTDVDMNYYNRIVTK